LYDGSYKLGVLRNGFSIFNVWGRQYLWPDYLVGVSLGWGDKLVKGENIKRVLFGNYVKVNWCFQCILITQKKSFWKMRSKNWLFQGYSISGHTITNADMYSDIMPG
jgi:hypothetical protein